MKEYKKEIERLIELNEITDPFDERIEACIADRFPAAYDTEQEYIEFQEYIGSLIAKK